jgi:transcriptional regulator with XRE-family HTH domain
MDYLPDELFGRSIKEMARICRVSERTVRRWKDRTRRPSEQELMLLRGDLGVFDAKWSGWTARDGFLISPEGWQITLNDILATKLKDAQIRAYQGEVRKLRYELEEALKAGYEDQPTPDSWDVEILVG